MLFKMNLSNKSWRTSQSWYANCNISRSTAWGFFEGGCFCQRNSANSRDKVNQHFPKANYKWTDILWPCIHISGKDFRINNKSRKTTERPPILSYLDASSCDPYHTYTQFLEIIKNNKCKPRNLLKHLPNIYLIWYYVLITTKLPNVRQTRKAEDKLGAWSTISPPQETIMLLILLFSRAKNMYQNGKD